MHDEDVRNYIKAQTKCLDNKLSCLGIVDAKVAWQFEEIKVKDYPQAYGYEYIMITFNIEADIHLYKLSYEDWYVQGCYSVKCQVKDV